MREQETTAIAEALLSGESLLVLGEPGSGKTTLGNTVRSRLERDGFTVGMVKYSGSAIDLLKELADQVGVDLLTDDDKPRNKKATELKADLLEQLSQGKHCLIADDAHRWSAALRYWLEDCFRAGVLLLLLAHAPQPRDIFAKLPVTELKPIAEADIRELIRTEAEKQRVKLSVKELAELSSRSGSNPAVAKRLVSESLLGLTEEKSADHHRFVDGTPLFLVGLLCLGTVRLVGLGLGDKALYILGGLLTLAALAIRMVLYAANRGSRRL
ncbi:MAG: ATP-binding protein [Leptolyngbyaceae cyanobacterium bins.302]|nr:ATP-binding protein [Leptolyngbyaceae cyanobacterium bins.302]